MAVAEKTLTLLDQSLNLQVIYSLLVKETEMTQTKPIEIDIDVHRAMERQRTSFDQSPNDILREVFKLPATQTPDPPSIRPVRKMGNHGFVLLGEETQAHSLKEAYMVCLRKLAELDEKFLERLAQERTRSRKIIALRPEQLYLRNPHLAEDFAQRLTGPWWVDLNLSRVQVEQRLSIACSVAGLSFGQDLKLL